MLRAYTPSAQAQTLGAHVPTPDVLNFYHGESYDLGRLKAASGMPPSDPERERVQIARLREIAMQAQLDPAFAEKWFNFVVAEVIHHHEQLATGAIATAPTASPDDAS